MPRYYEGLISKRKWGQQGLVYRNGCLIARIALYGDCLSMSILDTQVKGYMKDSYQVLRRINLPKKKET